jgi:hypothetical protein
LDKERLDPRACDSAHVELSDGRVLMFTRDIEESVRGAHRVLSRAESMALIAEMMRKLEEEDEGRLEADREAAGFVWKSVTMTAPDGSEMLVDGWGPPDDTPADGKE